MRTKFESLHLQGDLAGFDKGGIENSYTPLLDLACSMKG